MLQRPLRLEPRGPLAGALLLIATVALQALAFFDSRSPASLAAFAAIVPVMAYASSRSPARAALGGALAGAASLGLSCFWLAAYHRVAIVVGMTLGAFWFTLAFAAIAIVMNRGARIGPVAAAFLWSAAEWGRSYGFIAFPYSTLPYSQADRALSYALASFGGATLVGLAVALASASFYAALRYLSAGGLARWRGALLRAGYGLVALALFLAGGQSRPLAEDTPALRAAREGVAPEPGYARVALVQPDVRNQKSLPEYQAAFQSLSAQSAAALRYQPDLVVWHETAVVPPIEWHAMQRSDRPTYEFIAEVKRFIADFPVPLLTGNAYADPSDPRRAVEHNAALLYIGGELRQRYHKVKLVPFSEYLPAVIDYPFIEKPMVDRFGRFWTPGDGPVIFRLGDMRFAAPICFEDSFGRYLATFDEPDFFIVLTNDAWARSEAMQRQHLAMSRLRAAETGSMILRAASTGSTAAIDPRGAVVLELPAFTADVLVVDARLGAVASTFYERHGWLVEVLLACIGLALVAACLVDGAVRRRRLRIDNNDAL